MYTKVLQIKGKGKVVPVIFLIEHHVMKAYWGMEKVLQIGNIMILLAIILH
jgi:hypothetical protein